MTSAPQPAARPKLLRFQFSLRTLLIGMAVVAVGLAILDWRWIGPARRQRAAVRLVERLGGRVEYAVAPADESRFVTKLRDWFPRAYFDPVECVICQGTSVSERDITRLNGFIALRRLYLDRTKFADSDLVNIEGMTQLEGISFADTNVTDSGLAHLAHLKRLRFLYVVGTPITDNGLAHLQGLKHLRWVHLSRTDVTRDGVDELQTALPHCRISHSTSN